MRAALALLAAGLGLAAAADPPRRTAAVDIDGVEVRAGAAMNFPATGKLRKGETVIIVRDDDAGFYAIQPPPGSVSWVRQIHVGKVGLNDSGKANVPVAVDGAEVMAGSDKAGGPIKRITTRLPKGTIVEVVGPAVRVEDMSWLPVTPPDGDLRWVPKNAVKASTMSALAPPPLYARPETSPFTVSEGSRPDPVAKPAAAALPRALTDHRLWAQASQADKAGDYATAKGLYARIYQDLWDQKAERDAIVICYNRYTRCDELLKRGEGAPGRTESRRESAASTETTGRGSSDAKWSTPGYLQELQKVFVDGQPVYSLQDDRGNVIYYVTAVTGIRLQNFNNKRVQLYGVVSQRPELYRPHLAAERVEVAR
ncbi:MAG TPA: SH3 domain-containing protein [Gemmataceae bacterium]|nr:SH3 domain-containing protein [Gemmataceae bacterium]